LVATLSLFLGTQAHSENLNTILDQISSDLETKKATKAAAVNQTPKQPAQTESRRPSEPQEQSQKPKVATLEPKQSSVAAERTSLEQISPPSNSRESKNLIKAALANFDAKNYDAALEKLQAVNSKTPDDAFVLNLLGAAFTKKKDYKEAQNYFAKALINQPDFFPARFNVGELLFLKQRYAEALNYFQQMQARNPQNELLQFKVFLCRLQLGNKDDAAKALKAIKNPGDTPAWHYGQAAWASKNGDNKKALGYINGAQYIFGKKTSLFDETFKDLGINLH